MTRASARPAEPAAALVRLLDIDLADQLVDLRRRGEGAGEGERAADADRLAGGLPEGQARERRDGGADGGAARHGAVQGGVRRHRKVSCCS